MNGKPIEWEKFDTYCWMLTQFEYDDWIQKQFADEFSVDVNTICNWNKKVDWEAVKIERRKKYARNIIKVDNAVFKAACKGDVQAAKLLYERFDGFIPTASLTILESKDDDLLARATAIKNQLTQGIGYDSPGAGSA